MLNQITHLGMPVFRKVAKILLEKDKIKLQRIT